MRFGSVCSGIEAASVAFSPLGWKAAWFAEIDPFPCAVLAHHHPEVPNLGDMTRLPEAIRAGEAEAPDMLVGGTPCQAFSVAGLRQSLADERGNLSLTFCEIADAIDDVRRARGLGPAGILWENVPGVLSTADNAFGCFLAGLAGCDSPVVSASGWTDAGVVAGPRRVVAWRVLDAQGFVPQSRRRVFVVACGDAGRIDPVRVLFEPEADAVRSVGSRLYTGPLFPVRESLRGHPAAGRQAGQGSAADARGRAAVSSGHGWWDSSDTGATLRAQDSITKADTLITEVVGPLAAACGPNGHGGSGLSTNQAVDAGHCILHVASVAANAEIGENVAATLISHRSQQGGYIARTLRAQSNLKHLEDADTLVAHTLRGEGFDASEDGTGRGTPLVAVGVDCYNHAVTGDVAATLSTKGGGRAQERCIAAPTLTATNDPSRSPQSSEVTQQVGAVYAATMRVRRLMPVECERLQGFPDDYTRIPWRGKPASECPDGPRYKAIGNSWAVPVVAWIGRRIDDEVNA